MMDIDQSQRRDIDNIQNDKISLTIDDYNVINSPLSKNLYDFMVDGYNWIKNDNRIFKYNLVENDKLVFHINKINELFEKIITNIKISFEIENGNNNFIFNGVNLVHDDIIKSKTFNEFMNKKEMVFNCGTFNYSDLDFIVNGKEFDIELLFNGNKSNSMFSLKNIYVIFEFIDKLTNESDTVVNRLEPQIDFYRDENGDLILQIGDGASGKGSDHSRSGVDTYSKEEIDNKLLTKVNVEIGKGLSSNDYTFNDKIKLSNIENNANYYIHPSTHNSNIIVESSSLDNIGANEESTQHEINLAIDDKFANVVTDIDWSDIQNKPSDYPPSSHNHNVSNITDFPNIPSKISDLDNDSDFIEKSDVSGLVKNDGTIDTTNYLSSLPSHNHDDRYYTESEVNTALNSKQNTLISGTNIKTINNTSLLGTGNINIQGGGSVTVDSTWITGSTNPAESQLIQSALGDKTDVGHTHEDTEINSSYTNIEMGTLILATLDDVIAYNEPFTRINRALEHMLDNWEDYD